MPMVEIDELEFKQNQELRALANKIMANPKSRKLLEQATKVIDPQAKTPLIDHEEEINAPLKAMEKELAAFKAEREQDKADREQREKLAKLNSDIESGIGRLRAAGWTEEGIDGVRKLMDDKAILDVDIAASHFEKMHPPAAPVTPRGSGAWNFMEEIGDGEKDLQELIRTKGEQNALVDRMANKALEEARGTGRR